MLTTGMLILLVLLLLLGMPLVFAMGMASVAYLFFADISFSMPDRLRKSSSRSFSCADTFPAISFSDSPSDEAEVW